MEIFYLTVLLQFKENVVKNKVFHLFLEIYFNSINTTMIVSEIFLEHSSIDYKNKIKIVPNYPP
jgi:hypothetical protein